MPFQSCKLFSLSFPFSLLCSRHHIRCALGISCVSQGLSFLAWATLPLCSPPLLSSSYLAQVLMSCYLSEQNLVTCHIPYTIYYGLRPYRTPCHAVEAQPLSFTTTVYGHPDAALCSSAILLRLYTIYGTAYSPNSPHAKRQLSPTGIILRATVKPMTMIPYLRPG